MNFLLVVLKIVPANACEENYRNKNPIINYLRLSLLFPLSSDTQSYTKFLQLKSPLRMGKYYFAQPVQGARHTTLLYFYERLVGSTYIS